MAHQYIFTMQDLRKVHPPAKEVLKGIWLQFLPGAKIGVLGANGSGKSSLLRIMAGEDKDFMGEAYAAEGTKIGYLPQEPVLNPEKNVRENVEEGLSEIRALLKRFDEINAKFSEPMDDDQMNKVLEEQGRVQDKIDACGGWEIDHKVEVAMDALRCPPGDDGVAKLSGGEKRRVALARLLLSRPDLLILDEPTNHLDAESVDWLENFLQEFEGTVVAVTHDRYFLDNAAGWILELDRGKGIPYEGNYSGWLDQKRKRLQQEEKVESVRQRTLARELEWVQMSAKARHAKGKARLNRYEELLAEEQNSKVENIEVHIPSGPRLGDMVIEAKHLKKSFGDKLLIEDFSFKLPRGGIIGIIGPNGAGKTTLFRMIVGQEKPDAGELIIGDTVKLAYVDQSREDLDPDKTIWQEISEGKETITLGKREVNSRGYVSGFNFKGSDQQKKVGTLSGGERNRVQLAKLLRSNGNVLLLDEPTNDLDVDTLRALEEGLLNFAGCAAIISHDRWFLDRICTHIMSFEGDSKVLFFEGNYQEFEAWKKKELGGDVEPHRIKFKKISHD